MRPGTTSRRGRATSSPTSGARHEPGARGHGRVGAPTLDPAPTSGRRGAPVTTPHVALSWRRGIEPWYVAYALLGATAGGLVFILVPLHVSHSGTAAHVGLVMSAMGIGG